jgi:hypothetical protein
VTLATPLTSLTSVAQFITDHDTYSLSVTDEWQEGLQAIDDFDWSMDEQPAEEKEATPKPGEDASTVPCIGQTNTLGDAYEDVHTNSAKPELDLPSVYENDQQLKPPSPLPEGASSSWVGNLLEAQLDISMPDCEHILPEVNVNFTKPDFMSGYFSCEEYDMPSEMSLDQDDGIDLVDAESTHEVDQVATPMARQDTRSNSLPRNEAKVGEATLESLKLHDTPVLTSNVNEQNHHTVLDDSLQATTVISAVSGNHSQFSATESDSVFPSSTQSHIWSTLAHTVPVLEPEKLDEQPSSATASESPLSSLCESEEVPTDSDVDQNRHLSGLAAPHDLLRMSTGTEVKNADNDAVAVVTMGLGKRIRAMKSDGLSDTEEIAPARKKIKESTATPSGDVAFENTLQDLKISDAAPLEAPIKRLTSTESPKGSSQDVAMQEPKGEKELVSY